MATTTGKSTGKGKSKSFATYRNALVDSALSARSLRPSWFALSLILLLALASAFSLLVLIHREEITIKTISSLGIWPSFANVAVKLVQSVTGLIFLAATSALCKAVSLQSSVDAILHAEMRPHESKMDKKEKDSGTPSTLTRHQQLLLGIGTGHSKGGGGADIITNDSTPDSGFPRQRLPRSRRSCSPNLLAPLQPSSSSKNVRESGLLLSPWSGGDSDSGKGFQMSYISPTQGQTPPPPVEKHLSPWSKQRSLIGRDGIASEEKLEEFLANVEDRMVESASKSSVTNQTILTPSPTLRGIGGLTPSPITISTPHSNTPRTTPIRPLMISPGAQTFATPSKKGEGELPLPMSIEQAMDAFQKLGVYPQIEHWRDKLRQWFSEVLLNPLVHKIETSHIQVMQAAAKLGVSINVTQVGGNKPDSGGLLAPSGVSISSQEWVSTFAPDEDAMLHQLRAALVQARDVPPVPQPQPSVFGLQPPASSSSQVRPVDPLIQECIDAVTEHQRLWALMKGEWVKGLLPQSSVRADYTVHRIRDLAEGTCVKKYEFVGTGEVYDKMTKRWWTLELPTDSHLLIYLFCALLEHPQWMLHVDPTSHPSSQSGSNPLFVANMPPKERLPEKYVAVLSSAPMVLHTGACVLSVGKQSPPTFALYWDKKLQFSLQGRTALWDAILLLVCRIREDHGGVVRGINLGSSALNLFSVFEALDMDTLVQQ